MSTSNGSIGIRFIRNEAVSHADTDDSIRITVASEAGKFVLRYRDSNDGNPVVHRITVGRNQLLEHMYLLLKSQGMDDDGFKSVQFTLPAMPRLFVKISRFNEMYYREHLLELITNGLDTLETMKTAADAEKEWVCDDCLGEAEEAPAPAKTQDRRTQAWIEADIAEANARRDAARARAFESTFHSETRMADARARYIERQATPSSSDNQPRRSQRLSSTLA